MKTHQGKTLKQRQHETGRTLALNGAAWRKLRALVLGRDPLCRHCWDMGVIVSATEVDHINNDPTDNRTENLQGLCSSHHATKTRQDYGAKVIHGCDATGRPMDPAHHWNHMS